MTRRGGARKGPRAGSARAVPRSSQGGSGERREPSAKGSARDHRDEADLAPDPSVGFAPDSVALRDVGYAGDAGASAHYADPAYYERAYRKRRHDVAYYVRLARESGGPVLEYGVGNGRIALAVARAGIRVEGVDLSRPMLDDFEARLRREPPSVRARVTLEHGDMRSLRLGRRFPLVTAPFNALLHLYTRGDIEAFLARVREHLLPEGRFVFDVSVPVPKDLARDPERLYPAPELWLETGESVRYAERFEYDPLRQLLLVRMEFSPNGPSAPFVVPLTHRQFFPRELEALLHYNGFTEILFTADFSDAPADRHVDSLVVRARLQAGEPDAGEPPAGP